MNTITKKEFNKNIKELKEVTIALKQILTISSNIKKNNHLPYEICFYKVEGYIEKNLKKIEVLNKQYNCKHENVSDFNYVGHDHKNSYYEKTCIDCNFIVEQYSK
jgi:hypothetical protein